MIPNQTIPSIKNVPQCPDLDIKSPWQVASGFPAAHLMQNQPSMVVAARTLFLQVASEVV